MLKDTEYCVMFRVEKIQTEDIFLSVKKKLFEIKSCWRFLCIFNHLKASVKKLFSCYQFFTNVSNILFMNCNSGNDWNNDVWDNKKLKITCFYKYLKNGMETLLELEKNPLKASKLNLPPWMLQGKNICCFEICL